MAWFRNFYRCEDCGGYWTDEWSCTCDDDSRYCGARHISPYNSDDLTAMIVPDGHDFIVLWSPETAEHDADYRELGRFATRSEAESFLASG